MKGNWAKMALAALVLLLVAGCKGFWDAPDNGGTGTNLSGYFYVINTQNSQIAGYAINSSGVLTAVAGSPYTLPASVLPISAIAVSPNNNFLYASTGGGIFLYTIASDGSLTLGNSSASISNDQAVSMQVDATNSWLLNVSAASGYVYAIAISPTAGTITSNTELFAKLPVSTVRQVVISPDNSRLFVAMGTGGTATLPFNAASSNPLGAVSTIGVAGTGGAALSVAVDPLGIPGQTTPRVFYIGETAAVSGSNSGAVRVFNFSTLTEVSGSPYASQGLAPYWILPKSRGDYVYAVNRQTSSGSTGVIAGYSIATSGSSYALTPFGSTVNAGTNPQAMIQDSTGSYLLVTNYGGTPDLSGYTFSSADGSLVSKISSATGTDPTLASAIAGLH
ncbi:MAG: beta-propeller fold lactonase family protein [Terracidiphilus sp.]